MNFTTEVLKDRVKFEVFQEIRHIEERIISANRDWNNSVVYYLGTNSDNEVIQTLREGGYKVTQGNKSMPHLIKIEWESNRTINPFI